MSKKVKDAVAQMRAQATKDSLSEEARNFWEACANAVEELEAATEAHDIDAVKNRIDEIAANFAKQNEAVAEKVQNLKNEVMRIVSGGSNVKEQFTEEVRNKIAHALLNAHSKADAVKDVLDVAESVGIQVKRKKNDLTGLSFEKIVDYALEIKQDESDEIFDALYKTNRSKFFYGELDETDADEIAHEWGGVGAEGTAVKLIQELALTGKEIATAYVYKRQRIANEDLDDAAEHGGEAALEADVRSELRKAVKALIVKGIFIGDTVNVAGSRLSKFETIGTKTATDLFTTVVNPAIANTVTIAEVRKTADAVKTERKWAVMTSSLKLQLSQRPNGADSHFYTDAELAAQLGVDRVIVKDYIGNVNGLHVVVFDPSEYWVKEKATVDVAWPQYENNTRNYMYEINCGGAIHGLKSSAILAEAGGSSAS